MGHRWASTGVIRRRALRLKKFNPDWSREFFNPYAWKFQSRICEELGPLQNRKTPHKQNRAKISPKYRKSCFLSIFAVFLGYFESCCVFLSCRGPSLSQSRIENFNLDWKFQSRLKISIPTLIIPHNRSLIFNLAWKFQSRLKISIWDWSLESFNPGAKSWIFSIFGPSGSETGRKRFRRARFQTPSSVSFFGAHRVPGRELSEFLLAYHLCAKANSPSFSQNSPSCHKTQWGSVSYLLRTSTLEIVFRPFPSHKGLSLENSEKKVWKGVPGASRPGVKKARKKSEKSWKPAEIPEKSWKLVIFGSFSSFLTQKARGAGDPFSDFIPSYPGRCLLNAGEGQRCLN